MKELKWKMVEFSPPGSTRTSRSPITSKIQKPRHTSHASSVRVPLGSLDQNLLQSENTQASISDECSPISSNSVYQTPAALHSGSSYSQTGTISSFVRDSFTSESSPAVLPVSRQDRQDSTLSQSASASSAPITSESSEDQHKNAGASESQSQVAEQISENSDITNRFSFGVGRHLLAAKLFIFRGALQLRLFLPVSNVKHHEKAVLEQLTNLYNKNFNPRVKLRRQTLRSSLFRWLIHHGGATPELLGIKPESRMLVVRSTNGATRRREPSIAATETHDDQERWSSEYTHKSFKTPLEDIASRIVQDLRLYRYFLEGKTIELNKSSRESIRHGTNAYAEREADKFIKWKKSEEGAPSNDDASSPSGPTETCSDITALSERHQITLEDLKNKVMGAYDINDKLRMDDLDAFSFTTNGLDEFRNICIPDYDGSLKRCIDKCMNFEIAGLQNVDQKDIDEIISTIKESCGSYGMVIDPKAPMAPLQAMKSIASATLDLKRELDSNQKQLEEKIEKAMQLMHSMIERFDKEDSS